MFDFSFLFTPNHLIPVWFRWLDMLCLFEFAPNYPLWFSWSRSLLCLLICYEVVWFRWYPPCSLLCSCSCSSYCPMLSVWFLLSYCLSNLISFWPPVCPRGFDVLLSEGFLSLIGFYVKDISLLSHCCLFFVSVLLLSHCCLLLVLCLLYHCYILLVVLLSLHAIAISLPSFIGSDLYCLRGFLSHCYLLILCYCLYYCCLVSLLSLVSLDVLCYCLLCYCHCYCHLVSLIGSYLI